MANLGFFVQDGEPYFDLPQVEVADLRCPIPVDWECSHDGVWQHYTPPRPLARDEGWKIHISSLPSRAVSVLDYVSERCFDEGIAFKHLCSLALNKRCIAKDAPRHLAGKFITVYPNDDSQFGRLARSFAADIGHHASGKIMGDVRWGTSPVHMRFGRFRAASSDLMGSPIGKGRGRGVTPPIDLPPAEVLELGVGLVRAIQASYGTEVFLAQNPRTNDFAVVKRAHRHTGFDAVERDAMTRLIDECHALRELSHLNRVPSVKHLVVTSDRAVLTTTHLPGVPLSEWCRLNWPPAQTERDEVRYRDYLVKTTSIIDQVRGVLRDIHDVGLAHNDLHPGNILVDETDEGALTIYLCDFEYALDARIADSPLHPPPPFYRPGVDGLERDWFALDQVALWLLIPVLPPQSGAPNTRGSDHIGLLSFASPELPPEYQAALKAALSTANWSPGRAGEDRAPQIEQEVVPEVRLARLIDGCVRSLDVSAYAGRSSRLFPGDPMQFRDFGMLNFANGAAGGLWVLSFANQAICDQFRPWLSERMQTSESAPGGFLYGWHGAALALARLEGCTPNMRSWFPASEHQCNPSDLSLGYGLAGAVLCALRSGEPALVDPALLWSERLARFWRQVGGNGQVAPAFGLLDGLAGLAVLWASCYQASGERHWLARARQFMRMAIDEAIVASPDKTGFANGAAGVVAAFTYVDAACGVDELRSKVVVLVQRLDVIEFDPSLLQGNAGRLGALALAERHGLIDPAVVDRCVSSLELQAACSADGVALPGRHGLRLSMDYATGTAGLLAGLMAARRDVLAPSECFFPLL